MQINFPFYKNWDWGLGIGPNPQSPIPNKYIQIVFSIINYIKFIFNQ